jgi:predicted porin
MSPGLRDWRAGRRKSTKNADHRGEELRMRKHIAALAAAGAALCVAAGAQAQSTVSLYGLLDMSAGRFQSPGADAAWRAESGSMTTSYIGVRGAEDLGGGLKARFALEHFLRVDSGAAGRRDTDAFWARNAYVGFDGYFGASLLGRNTTPLFVATVLFNPFGDSFGFSPSIRHYFLGAVLGDSGWSNSLRYISADTGNLTFELMGNLAEGPAEGKNLSAGVRYASGPLAATAVWQDVGNGAPLAPTGFDGQNTIQFGLSYDLEVAKLFGQYGEVKTHAAADTRTKLYQLGISVPLGLGAALASYGNARAETGGVSSRRKTLSLGYDYRLSKNTDVYAALMNDQATGVDDGTTAAAGIRLRF